MKKFFDGLTHEILGVILLFLLLSPIFAVSFYNNNKDSQKNLRKVCGAYESIIKTLRNETLEEEIERLRKSYKFPDKNTTEGRIKLALLADESEIINQCSAFGTTASFPTYEEIERGQKKQYKLGSN